MSKPKPAVNFDLMLLKGNASTASTERKPRYRRETQLESLKNSLNASFREPSAEHDGRSMDGDFVAHTYVGANSETWGGEPRPMGSLMTHTGQEANVKNFS